MYDGPCPRLLSWAPDPNIQADAPPQAGCLPYTLNSAHPSGSIMLTLRPAPSCLCSPSHLGPPSSRLAHHQTQQFILPHLSNLLPSVLLPCSCPSAGRHQGSTLPHQLGNTLPSPALPPRSPCSSGQPGSPFKKMGVCSVILLFETSACVPLPVSLICDTFSWRLCHFLL